MKVHGPRAWLISVVPIDEKKHKSEADLVDTEMKRAAKLSEFTDSDPGYVRWTGNSMFRKHAKAGDIVIAIWRPHAKSKRGKVFALEPLLHRKDNGNVTHLSVEEYADRDDTVISFTDFVTLWRRSGSTGRAPRLNSTREVQVELIEHLRAAWNR